MSDLAATMQSIGAAGRVEGHAFYRDGECIDNQLDAVADDPVLAAAEIYRLCEEAIGSGKAEGVVAIGFDEKNVLLVRHGTSVVALVHLSAAEADQLAQACLDALDQNRDRSVEESPMHRTMKVKIQPSLKDQLSEPGSAPVAEGTGPVHLDPSLTGPIHGRTARVSAMDITGKVHERTVPHVLAEAKPGSIRPSGVPERTMPVELPPEPRNLLWEAFRESFQIRLSKIVGEGQARRLVEREALRLGGIPANIPAIRDLGDKVLEKIPNRAQRQAMSLELAEVMEELEGGV